MADAADLARTMLDLHRARRTAVLTVQGKGVRTLVFFHEGAAVWAGEGAVDRTLGRMLLRDGLLDPEQYGTVIERMTEGLAKGKELRFGDLAVELGYLERQQVTQALHEQARRKIMDCVAYEDCDIEVTESAEEVAAVPHHQLCLEALVADGIRLHWDDGRTGPLVGALAHEKPTLRGDAGALGERLGLGLADLALLAGMDGTRTTRVLVDGSALGADQAARLFSALVVLDYVAFTSTKSRVAVGAGGRPAGTSAQPPAAVRPKAAPPAARSAAAASPKAPPAAVPAKPAAPPQPAAAPAPATGAQPSGSPSPMTGRISQLPPELRRTRLEAEQLFQAGRGLLAEGQTFPAARKLRRAAALFPEAAEYALWAEWAEYKAERDPAEVVKRHVRLKNAAIAALQQDKMLAMGHYLLGVALSLEGDRDTSVRFLRRAVELDPGNAGAVAELQKILAAKPKKK